GPDPNENPTNIKLLTDANAKQIRIYSGTTFDISRDFGTTHTGKIYLRDTPFSGDTVNLLYNAMQRAKMYLANGVKVTLWIQLYTDRDKNGTKLAKGKTIGADGLRSPEEFKQWYATLAKAQISINDSTKVTDVINAFEIDNEPNLLKGQYWPNVSAKGTSQQQQIDNNINSYIDHDLVPAYSVFSKIGKTVIGAGLATGTATDYDELNGTDNPTGSRYLQYSMNCDLMNFHPYGTIGTTSTPDAKVQAFIGQMYKDPKVTNKFVITEFSVHDLLHNVVDIDPSDQTAAANFQRAAYISELNEAQNYLVNDPTAKKKLSTIYYFTLLTQKDDRDTHTDGVVYALPDSTTYQTTVFYDVFKDWAMGI
ncbi:MAG TPA: hypothetical protein VHS31_15095, partial [Tepidisphaeraceae bacterium]|nr:hypothetical protein [Tepidisphaeraceae bacterium]